jgi:lysophospholipase L1-like esterase
MSVILCYGDSNTHGTRPMRVAGVSERYAPEDRWPEVMGARLGAGFTVISEGLPGRTTVHEDLIEGGARSGLAVLPAVLHSHKPLDLLILMLGTNDLKPRFSVTAHEIARSALRLARLARAEDVVQRILVVAPAPIRPAGCLTEVFAGAEQRQQGLEAHLRQMAEAEGVGFLTAGDHVSVSPTDGVHWEAEAHRQFGAVMARQVQEALA